MNICCLLLAVRIPDALGALAVIAAGLLFYVYVGYPLLLAALGLFFRRPRTKAGYTPSITVLIAAYNEEAAIRRKIEQTLSLEYPADKLEILVVSDGSTDRTDEIVELVQDPRVRLLRMKARGGKTNGQNEGVKHCRGEIVVFSDATAIYHTKALLYLASHYSDPKVGAVSGRYKYFDPEDSSSTGLGSVAFWNYENMIKLLQSRIGTLTGCSGCIYSVRRSNYVPLRSDACSDLVEPLCIVRNGYRVAFEDRALAYEETTKNASQEFRMRVRVATRGMRGLLSVPQLLQPWRHGWTSFQLFSHKLLRWMVPVFLILLFAGSAANLNVTSFRLLFAAQVLFYSVCLFNLLFPLHRRWKLLGIPLFFCTLNAAALVSMLEVLRGHKFTTWDPIR
jgi:cellulose synthase/poly-beta-1,6-N-acetylglucosamine synthase-like glycosyltransferase